MSCVPIAGKCAPTRATFAATVATFAKMPEIAKATSANCARTNVRALHRLSCGRIDRRSEATAVTSAAIAGTFGLTLVIGAAMFATTDVTAAKRGTIR